MDIIEIALFGSAGIDDTREAIAKADVIIGVDTTTQREFTVFGCPSLESTTSLKRPSAMRTVRVTIDCRAGQLEMLLELVRAVKGHADLEGTE